MNFDSRPPLPEASSASKRVPPAPRPPELDIASSLLVLFSLIGLLLFDPSTMRESLPQAFVQSGRKAPTASEDEALVAGTRVVLWTLTMFWLACIYAFWKGRGWGRILVMIGSGVSLLNFFSIAALPNLPSQMFLLLDVIFSAYMLYWLWQPNIAHYFQRPREAGSA